MKQINMTDEQYEIFKKLIEGTELSSLANKDKDKEFKIPKKIDIKIDMKEIKTNIDKELRHEHIMMRKRMQLLIKYAKVYYPFVWKFIKKINDAFSSKIAENGPDSTLNWHIPNPIKIKSFIFSKERELYYLSEPKHPIYLCNDSYRAFSGNRTEYLIVMIDAKYDKDWNLGHPHMIMELGSRNNDKVIELDNDDAPNKLKAEFDNFAKELFNRYLR